MEKMLSLADGRSLCLEEFGNSADPLMIHIEGHGAQLVSVPESYCQRLAGAGFYVIRFDNRDVGRSSRTPYPYDLRDMAADVAAMIRYYGQAAVVTGRSMGGAIAQLLALDYPQLVCGLGLFFTYAKNSSQLVKPARTAPFSNRDQFLAWHFRQISEIAGSKYPWEEKQLPDLVAGCWQRGFSWEGLERQRQAMERTVPWAQRLGEIQVPVSIVHGEEDPVIPPAAGKELHRLIPQSRLHLVPGMGHQQPAAANDLFIKATLEATEIPGEAS